MNIKWKAGHHSHHQEAGSEAMIIFPEIFQCGLYIYGTLIMKRQSIVWFFSQRTYKKTTQKWGQTETTFAGSRMSLILTWFWQKTTVKILAKSAVHFLQRGCVLSWKRRRTLLLPLLHPWNAIFSCCGNLPIDTLPIHTAKLLALSWQGILFYTQTAIVSLMTCYISLQEERGYCLMTHEHIRH